MHYKEGEAGICVGGQTRQRLTTLIPELGAVVRLRGNGVNWVLVK